MASTMYTGDSWPSAVVVLQRAHVLLRLCSGSPEVAVSDFCCGVFPRGAMNIVFCMYILPPHQIRVIRTFNVTFCDN